MCIHDNKQTNRSSYWDAIKLLSRQDYSKFKLIQLLKKKGFSPDDIEITIEKLVQKGLYNEQNYTHSRIRGLINKGYAPKLIKYKLKLERIDIHFAEIDSIYQELNLNPQQQLQHYMTKYLKKINIIKTTKSWPKLRSKVLFYFYQKGYNPEEIGEVLETLIGKQPNFED